MALKYDCLACRKQVTATKNNRYRSHTDGAGEPCENNSVEIPEHILAQPVGADDAPDVPREGVDFAICPQCERKVKLTRLGYFEPHDETLKGGDRCGTTGVRAKHARRTETVPLPGDDPKPATAAVPKVKDSARPVANRGLALEASSSGARESSPESSTTSADSPEPDPAPSTSLDAPSSSPDDVTAPEGGPFRMAPDAVAGSRFFQPFSPFSQPGEIPPRIRLADAMSERGKEIAARLRETFYAYTNRNERGNRSAQRTLGPSEIGTPCDRQLAMKLLGIQPVNPQEGWAPFVGTAVHAELARMFEWANGAQSGRYVVEMPVSFGSELVPYGTLDLLDRVLYMIDDHKLMGRYSLDKLIQQGPSETYRTQIQVYGLGATLAGEKVKEVAIIAWPRQESSLDKLYVHVEPFDKKVAEAAIARVERIAREVQQRQGPGSPADPVAVARQFEVSDDCKWCPFYLKGDKGFTRGCPGK